MKKAILSISVCVIVIVVLTMLCTDSASAGTAGTASGTVLFDGKPVAGAGIYLLSRDYYDSDAGMAEKLAETGRDGTFTIAVPADIDVQMTSTCIAACHPDHAIGWVTLRGGEDMVQFTLEREGLIEGRVTYGDSGKPAPNVRVLAIAQDYKKRTDYNSAVTDT